MMFMKCLPARSNLMRRRRLSALRLNLQSGDQWHQHGVSMQLVQFMRVQRSSSLAQRSLHNVPDSTVIEAGD